MPTFDLLNKNIIKMRQVQGLKSFSAHSYSILSHRHNSNNYDQLTTCIQTFRYIPQSLQSFLRNPEHPHSYLYLQKLILCSNTFVEVANLRTQNHQVSYPQQRHEQQAIVQLFHRFFSRIRQVLYFYLGKFIHYNGYTQIRQFLIQINKQMLKYYPGVDPNQVLLAIASVIRNKVSSILNSSKYGVNLQDVAEKLMEKCIKISQSYKNPEDQEHKNHSKAYYFQKRAALQENKKQQDKRVSRIIAEDGLQIIRDLDVAYYMRLKNAQSQKQSIQDSLYRQCLNRNRYISSLMQKFTSKYQVWYRKPLHKKNRVQNQYRPTSCEQTYYSKSKQVSSPTYNSVNKNKIRKNKYEDSSKISNKSTYISNVIEQNKRSVNQEYMREQLMKYISINRQKQCLNKVILIGTNLQFTPTFKNKNKNQSNLPTKKRSLHSQKANNRKLRLNQTVALINSGKKHDTQHDGHEIQNCDQNIFAKTYDHKMSSNQLNSHSYMTHI